MRKEKTLLHRPIYLNKEADYVREMEEEWERRRPLTKGEKYVLGCIGLFFGGGALGCLILGLLL